MVIEWLKFKVAAESREKFIEKDEAIWTATLASYPGFLGKQIWLNPNIADEIILVIHWQTREQWKSIPQAVLEETEKKFKLAMGEVEYKMTESLEYQVRKFPQSSR